eukprot:CAMPEP_0183788976 /NCGR_PEP_ID=MMETSP0803_2-20130417/134_1 /TAXON_ID=195967 /ORGANISM="Crustomastix stigmata, Strain CCMP3273" /LENGTH=57 /DNA_ID=CAMNT_0026033127 /DNA_START=47 /DNA_END=220 /DNA_ORIENTATION=-
MDADATAGIVIAIVMAAFWSTCGYIAYNTRALRAAAVEKREKSQMLRDQITAAGNLQ